MSTIASDFVPPHSRVVPLPAPRLVNGILAAYLGHPEVAPESRFQRFATEGEGAFGFHMFGSYGTQFYLHFTDSSEPELWAVVRGRAVLLLTEDDDMSDLGEEDLEVARLIRADLVKLCPAPSRS